MRWTRRYTMGALPVAALLAATAGCGSSSTSTPTGGAGGASTGGGGAQASVTAQNTAFNPTSLSVPASSQVTISFSNKDSVEHSITFDDNSQSVDADGGATQTLTFMSAAAGTTIPFHCKYHPTRMKGTITVGGSGGGGGAAPPPSQSTSTGNGY